MAWAYEEFNFKSMRNMEGVYTFIHVQLGGLHSENMQFSARINTAEHVAALDGSVHS